MSTGWGAVENFLEEPLDSPNWYRARLGGNPPRGGNHVSKVSNKVGEHIGGLRPPIRPPSGAGRHRRCISNSPTMAQWGRRFLVPIYLDFCKKLSRFLANQRLGVVLC
jgi:hypothetical protein